MGRRKGKREKVREGGVNREKLKCPAFPNFPFVTITIAITIAVAIAIIIAINLSSIIEPYIIYPPS